MMSWAPLASRMGAAPFVAPMDRHSPSSDPVVIAKRYGEPLVGLHRGALHAALIEALGEDRLQLGREVRGLTDDGLRLVDGTEIQADLVVGADGLHSTLRSEILDETSPEDSGIVAYRGVAPWDGPVPAGEWWGGGEHRRTAAAARPQGLLVSRISR